MARTRKPHGPSKPSTAELARRLQQDEAALLAIPGVTGCGVGLAADGSAAIQVFVAEARRAEEVRKAVSGILRSVPAEVVVMPLPSAD